MAPLITRRISPDCSQANTHPHHPLAQMDTAGSLAICKSLCGCAITSVDGIATFAANYRHSARQQKLKHWRVDSSLDVSLTTSKHITLILYCFSAFKTFAAVIILKHEFKMLPFIEFHSINYYSKITNSQIDDYFNWIIKNPKTTKVIRKLCVVFLLLLFIYRR